MTLGSTVCAALIPLLTVVPYYFPTDPSVASVATLQGYNNGVAHTLVVLWSVALMGIGVWQVRRSAPVQDPRPGFTAEPAPVAISPRRSHLVGEIALIWVACLVLYFPPALARYGPYVEDNAFLTMLQRMYVGQHPYVDFECLYGPLMLYPAYAWMRWFGYSMASYYGFLCIEEAVQYTVLYIVLFHYLPRFGRRAPAFLLFGIFVLNTYLGLNYSGLRRLLPAYVILLVSGKPHAKLTVVTAALLLGTLLAYSHESGLACLVAVLALFVYMMREAPAFRTLRRAATLAVVSLVVWFAWAGVVAGKAFPAYVRTSFHIMARMRAGEQAFAFHWTLNSLALFGLLGVACLIVGQGLGRTSPPRASSGDYLLLGAVVYALIALRGGLNRAGIFHLTPPMLVLVCAFVLPASRTVFVCSRDLRRFALVLIAVMAGTYLLALAPEGSYYARGLVRGWRDIVAARSLGISKAGTTPMPAVELERSHPSAAVLALSAYLTHGQGIQRPVVFYDRAWWLDKRIGVPGRVYPPDDFLLSDAAGVGIRKFLERHTDTVVVMMREAYEHLVGGRRAAATVVRRRRLAPMTATKTLAAWLSSVHFRAVAIEWDIKERRWARTVGRYIRSHYRVVRAFGRFVVLERDGSTQRTGVLTGSDYGTQG